MAAMFGASCARAADPRAFPEPKTDVTFPAGTGPQTAVLAGGCFWCTEAVFELVPGVLDVESGYIGGEAGTANYRAVCTGRTGHAEAIKITYDPAKVSYGQLLKTFFSLAHDPTTLNRQGADEGTQYRSAVFFANERERAAAADYIKQVDELKLYDRPVVTTLEPAGAFYVAEANHQDYARLNPDSGYIQAQAMPKVEKTRKYVGEQAAATQPTGT